MKVLVFELNSFHIELLPMYQPLMPSLFGDRELDIHYYVLPSLVERARDVVGCRSMRSPHLACGVRCRPRGSGASTIGGGFSDWSTALPR